jgi:putative PEP-CTERM system TPR-repeat lipoprotein
LRALELLAAFLLATTFAACSDHSPEQQLAAARLHLEQGDARTAVIEAKNFLAAKPESAAGRYVLGRALFDAGDVNGAAVELKRAESLGHPENELAPALAALWLAQGRSRDVVASFGSKTLSDPAAAAELLTLVAQAQRDQGNPEKATQSVQEALKLSPGNSAAVIFGARLDADRGELPAALAVAAGLVAKPDASAQAWLLQGDLLALQGSASAAQAIASYRKALELRPRLAEAHIGLVMALLRQNELDAARTQIATMRKQVLYLPMVDYLDGLTALLQGDLPHALEMTEQLDKRAEPTAATNLLGGMVYSRLGNIPLAELHLQGAIAASPQWLAPRREMAALQLRQGQPGRALEALTPVLSGNPDDADLWAMAGQAYARLGDFVQADAAFTRALALRPGSAGIRGEMARSQINRGNVDLGLHQLEAAANADVDGISSDLMLVATYARAGNRKAALEALEVARRKQPDQPLPLFLRGRLLEEGGDRAGARAAYEAALAKNPRMLQAVAALSALDLAEHNPAAARKRHEELIKLDPTSASAYMALAGVVLRTGGSVAEIGALIDKSVQAEPKNASNWRAAINLQRALGNAAATLARAQAANAAVPDDATLMLELANAQGASGQWEQALVTLRRAALLQPQSAEPLLRLAVAFGMMGNTAAAREPLQRALALAPDAPGVLRGVIALDLADKQPDRARARAREVQQRMPKAPLGWDLEAELDTTLGDPRGAAAAFQKALDRAPSSERAVLLHRQLLAADPAAARQFQDKWLKASPGDVLFMAHVAETALAAGNRAQAEALYRQALQLQPDNALLLNNLAELLLQRNDAQALGLAERAVAQSLPPQQPAVLDTLASAQAAAGKRELALQTQSKAVALAPTSGLLRLRLAQYLHANDDDAKARVELASALRLGLPPDQTADAERLGQALAK